MKQTTYTLEDIAKKIGVSVATASRVLSGKAKKNRISEETEKAILAYAQEVNYSPNQLARSLRLQSTHTLGYIIPDISNPFFSSIAKVVEKIARSYGYSIILSDSGEDTKLENEALQLLLSRKTDGIIISPVGKEIKHLIEFKERKIPIVFIDRYFPELNIPFVTSDNYQGAYEAVEYLIKNGHKRIACIQGLKNTSPNNDRIRGYIDAQKNNRIAIDRSLIVGDSFGEANGYNQAKKILKKENRPTAIFAVSNLISLGVLRALKEEGLVVPDDISLISFDDQPYSSYLATPMTTVTQSVYEIGKTAVKLLIDQIETKKIDNTKRILIPTTLIVRNSVKPL